MITYNKNKQDTHTIDSKPDSIKARFDANHHASFQD